MASLDVEGTNVGIHEDEQRIGNRYRYLNGFLPVAGGSAIIFGAAEYADIKWVVATGFALVIGAFAGQDVRNFDIAVRTARTNLLLRDIIFMLPKRRLS
jgi:hypothetical protein